MIVVIIKNQYGAVYWPAFGLNTIGNLTNRWGYQAKLNTDDILTIGGGLTVTGDLIVSGDTTTVNTATLSVEDPLVYLANGQSGTPSVDIGLIGERGSSTNVGIIWDESADTWAAVNTSDTGTTAGNVTIASYANMKAATFTGALTGDVTGNADTATKIASITNSNIVQLTDVQTLTNKTITGTFTGNITGNASGTAATVTGATQAAITSAAILATVRTITTGVWSGTAIASAKIADDAITSAKIADDAITTALIADDQITTATIADDAITTATIADDQITTATIADDQITTATICLLYTSPSPRD